MLTLLLRKLFNRKKRKRDKARKTVFSYNNKEIQK